VSGGIIGGEIIGVMVNNKKEEVIKVKKAFAPSAFGGSDTE
jgi:hypothetical protein